jgi:hypothetical protein
MGHIRCIADEARGPCRQIDDVVFLEENECLLVRELSRIEATKIRERGPRAFGIRHRSTEILVLWLRERRRGSSAKWDCDVGLENFDRVARPRAAYADRIEDDIAGLHPKGELPL